MKIVRKILSMILILILPTLVYAVPSAPPGGSKPGETSTSISYSGNTTITSNTTETDKSYSSTTGGKNSLLVSGGTSTISNPTITKSGDSSGDDADFYGINAAILTYNGATLNIKGGNITTNGSHANAVFSYGTGVINISDTNINTTSNNSGGVMVTGGGTLTANNLTVKTSGNSSASIRSDRGGGTLTVNGGTYQTDGVGSPAIYSTADIIVNDATLISTSSEGIVVEGSNKVTLNNTKLTDTNNSLNGNSETYKNIFLYQSMSGDANEGTAQFTAKDSIITTNKGDTIFVTNTSAVITLENNTISNSDGDFLRIQKGKWGNSGSNGGTVILNLSNQDVTGNIIVDSISTLDLNISNKSVYRGSIDSENQAKSIKLTLSSDSVIVLSKDTYIDSLTNESSDNSNIYLNGYKLYVDGKEVSANNSEYNSKDDNENTSIETSNEISNSSNNSSNEDNNTDNNKYILIIGIVVILISAVILHLKSKKNK